MLTNHQLVSDAAIEVGLTDHLDGLNDIHRPGVAAVIWQRQPVPHVQDWIDRVDPAVLPHMRAILQPNAVRDAVEAACDGSGLPDAPERGRLIDDIATLCDFFARLMAVPFVRLRMDVVTHNACPKFHIDAVTARLICTYRGTGTQYGISTNGADPRRVLTVPTGDAILLRGKCWPDMPSSSLLHRSPPIEGTGETRLMLVVDPVLDPEEAY